MLYNTDITDPYNAAYIGQMAMYSLGTYSDPGTVNSLLQYAAGAPTSYSMALSWYLNGITEYNFLKEAISSDEGFEQYLVGMSNSMKNVVKRQNCIIRVVGSEESRKASVDSMLARLPKKNKTYKAGTVAKIGEKSKNIKTMALEMNTQAGFLMSLYSGDNSDVKELAAEMVALSFMSNAVYIPQFRYVLGAYGAYCGATSDGLVYAQLYRSPEVI